MNTTSPRRATLVTGAAALLLAAGWGFREAQFAAAQARRVPNVTIDGAAVPLKEAQYEGRTRGRVAVLLEGDTATTRGFVAGRYLLNPGEEPHAPHRHAEEELLLVTAGEGEILCAGKTTRVRPGSLMYADPNVEHGIRNTGRRPLEFYWVKYVGGAR